MPEVIVKYKTQRTLQALKDFAKYFDFVISSPEKKTKKETLLNGVTLTPSDHSIDTSDLSDIFTGKNINPSQLRAEVWQTKK